MKSAVMPR